MPGATKSNTCRSEDRRYESKGKRAGETPPLRVLTLFLGESVSRGRSLFRDLRGQRPRCTLTYGIKMGKPAGGLAEGAVLKLAVPAGVLSLTMYLPEGSLYCCDRSAELKAKHAMTCGGIVTHPLHEHTSVVGVPSASAFCFNLSDSLRTRCPSSSYTST